MTRNQLELVKHKENVRHNIATEGLTSQTLAETIANNLRNYKVNVSKNQITKLANDQLDDRERSKLAEEIRNNLTRNLETYRHNLKDEEIRAMKNAIDSLRNKYEIGPIVAALLGLMPDDEVTKLYGAKAKKLQGTIAPLFGKDVDYPGLGQGIITQSSKNKTTRGKRWEDENEIPTDFSSSRGPAKNDVFRHDYTIDDSVKTINGRRVRQYDQPIGPAPAPIANPSTIDRSSNVIYHPSTKKSDYGPGFSVPGAN